MVVFCDIFVAQKDESVEEEAHKEPKDYVRFEKWNAWGDLKELFRFYFHGNEYNHKAKLVILLAYYFASSSVIEVLFLKIRFYVS